MIFHNLETIFLHIGKTAGVSVERMLHDEELDFRIADHDKMFGWDATEKIYLQHATAETIRRLVGDQLFYRYYKFTVVRNPFARMVSVYFYLYGYHQRQFGSFTQFIEQLPGKIQSKKVLKGSHYIPQVCYTKIDGENVCDRIAHFERLPQSLDSVRKQLKITSSLEHHNTYRHPELSDMPVVEHYTSPQSIHIIQDLFAEDFETFGYSFDVEIQKPIV